MLADSRAPRLCHESIASHQANNGAKGKCKACTHSPCNFIRAHWAGTPPWNKFLLRCSWRRLGKSAKSGGSSPEKFCPFRYISVTWQAVPLEKEQSYRTQFISSLLESHGPAVRFQLQRGTPSPAAIRRRTRPVSKELSLGDS